MAFDKKGFLSKLAKKDSPVEEKAEYKGKKKGKLDPVEVFRLALHDPEAFCAAFEEAVKYVKG